jgi:predicted nucleic acid-binding protein
LNVLVDTNVISELKRGRNAAANVVAWFAAMPVHNVFTSVVVLGEIRRGIELVARRDKLQADVLERWYSTMRRRLGDRVIGVDEPVMTAWSKITVPDMLPAYDGLIAATALVHGMTIATRNTADYRRAGIAVIDPWVDTPPV